MEGSRKLGRVRSSCLLRRVTCVILFLVFTMRGKDPTHQTACSYTQPSVLPEPRAKVLDLDARNTANLQGRNNSDQNGMEHGSVIHSNTISCMESNKQVQC